MIRSVSSIGKTTRTRTHDFVLAKKADFLRFNRRVITPWAALDYLNTLVDDSDPDIGLPQIDHLLQTAEAIRADGHPDWMVLTGFIHDLGKVLCLFGEPQWAVVGDTFPTGCPYSSRIVYSEFFAMNADSRRKEFQTGSGIYAPNCGLSSVQMSWGHDEYLYHLVKFPRNRESNDLGAPSRDDENFRRNPSLAAHLE